MIKFQVGESVKCLEELPKGMIGIVRCVSEMETAFIGVEAVILVEYPHFSGGGRGLERGNTHDCEDRGWWSYSRQLKRMSKAQDMRLI